MLKLILHRGVSLLTGIAHTCSSYWLTCCEMVKGYSLILWEDNEKELHQNVDSTSYRDTKIHLFASLAGKKSWCASIQWDYWAL